MENKNSMKRIILTALSLMLMLGMVFSLGIIASASENTSENGLPTVPDDFGKITPTLEEQGLAHATVWNAFPNEITHSYHNGIFYVNDNGFDKVEFWSYQNYETYELTLTEGKWQHELSAEIGEGGGLIYAYLGNW